MSSHIVSRRAEVEAVLEDPRFVVPTAEPGSEGVAWLRATVSRFANGDTHARRRRIVEAAIERLDPDELAAAAGARTRRILDDVAGRQMT